MSKKIIQFSILLALLITSIGHAEQIYRWVDKNGKVHFGDRPQNSKTQSITVKQQPKIGGSTATPSTNTPASQQQVLDAYSERRAMQKQQKAKADQEKQKIAAHKKKCANAKNYLAKTKGMAMARDDGKGGRSFLTDAEIKASREKYQAEIDKHCR